jgi:type VI secretion system secreted protein Hcp
VADCFIKIEQVKGEAQDQEFKDYIQVDSWHWGVAVNRSQAQGEAGKMAGRAQVNNLTFVHQADTACAGLLTRCVKNALIPTATLVMRRAGGSAQKYLTINLEKVRINSVELVHDAQHVIPAVQVVLNFDRVIFEYTPQSEKGADKSGRSSFDWLRLSDA